MARRKAAQEQRKIAIAFAGAGDSTIENTADLLNDWLGFEDDGPIPDEDVLDIRMVVPAAKSYLSPGLKSVVAWLDHWELAYDAVENLNEAPSKATAEISKYAEHVEQSKDVNRSLIAFLDDNPDTQGFEKYLVLAWGAEGTDPGEDAEILLDLASSAGIEVRDLTAGLDTLGFGGEEEPEEAPAPDPEPEPVKPTRSRRRAPSKTEEEPPFEPDPPKDEEKPAARRPRTTTKKAEEIGPTPKGEPTLQEQLGEARAATFTDFSDERKFLESASSHDMENAWVAWAEKRLPEGRERSLVITKIQEAAMWAYRVEPTTKSSVPQEAPESSESAVEEPKRGRGRPRTLSAAKRAVVEIWDDVDKEWVRAGRGRLPADVKTRKVDPDTGEVVA